MWPIFIFIAVVLAAAYCLLIFIYFRWFTKLKPFEPDTNLKPVTRFSIVIAARNEEKNIEKCVRSVIANNYPKNLFEIIVADDFSTDATAAIVKKMQEQFSNIRLIQLENIVDNKLNSYKKKAIESAINESLFEWIVCTDADCIVPSNWLRLFDAYIQSNNCVFVAAPVKFINNNSFISIFQCLDFISLQGITAASVSAGFHSMCNGANLAYSKEAFYKTGGFTSIDNIASGDDMLLMYKMEKSFPGGTGYLFNSSAIVETQAMQDWKSFINQRIRWASKATGYNDKKIFLVLLLVYLFNLCLFLMPFLSILNPQLLFYWIGLLFAKTVFELVFMDAVSGFFNEQKLLWWFPLMQPLHIAYTVVSGWLGSFKKYEWKDRTVK
ncbi:MAG TPA: glycosyltransferase [Panacibacter sp.]|nr:glycosyltransferase [Panacibacter sp.]